MAGAALRTLTTGQSFLLFLDSHHKAQGFSNPSGPNELFTWDISIGTGEKKEQFILFSQQHRV